jgi:hypothetical protein
MQNYIEELDQLKSNPSVLRMRTRGRKSKKTAYMIDLVGRLDAIEKIVGDDEMFALIETWRPLLGRT